MDQMMGDTMQKIVVIGAGPAGITAACELLKQSDKYEVVVLEASQQVGGLAKTVCDRENRIDLGGHRFFAKDERIISWWTDILPVVDTVDADRHENVMLIRKRISRIRYHHHFYDYPVQLNRQTLKKLGFIRAAGVLFSYLGAVIHKRPERSLEDFYRNRFGERLYRLFFQSYTYKLWGVPASQIAKDWGQQRVRGLSVRRMLWERFSLCRRQDSEITAEHFAYPKYGPGQLWSCAAAQIENMGGEILMGYRVVEIREQASRICSVVCETPDGRREISGDIFVSSMPMRDLVTGMQHVPGHIYTIAADLPYRSMVIVTVEIQLKPGQSYPKDCWIYAQEQGVQAGRIQIYNNWSPWMVEDPACTVLLGLEYFCNMHDAVYDRDPADWKRVVLSDLRKLALFTAPVVVKRVHCIQVPDAYPGYYGSYEYIDDIRGYLDTYENLYVIGRNGQHRYHNMEHAMQTAMRAVTHIVQQDHDTRDIWGVNQAAEYIEK